MKSIRFIASSIAALAATVLPLSARIEPVPEPSTYGIIGVVGLVAMVAYRSFSRRK